MTLLAKGLLVAAVQVLLVAAVGGALLYERHALPRVWVLTTGVDPVLPIRGRYVSLRLVVEPRGELPEDTERERWSVVETTLAAASRARSCGPR